MRNGQKLMLGTIDRFNKAAIVRGALQTTRFSDGAVRKELEARLIRASRGTGTCPR